LYYNNRKIYYQCRNHFGIVIITIGGFILRSKECHHRTGNAAIVILALFLGTIIFATSPVAGGEAATTLNIALAEEPDNLNPVSDANAYDIMKIYSGLVKSDEDLKMIADLAESWEVSPDGKTFTFHLRSGVKWQDGEDFTADDVLFTYDIVRDDKWLSVFPVSSEYKNIEDITIPDQNTVKFTLKEGIVPYLERFALPILPKHILDGQDLTTTEFWQKPVGTGPFQFQSWKHAEELVLVANPGYFGPVPKVDTLRYIIVPDGSARVNLLKTGEVDAIQIDPLTMKVLENESGIVVHSVPSAQWYSMNMPNKVWPFNIKEVRQAMGYAINKQQIVDTIFMGQGVLAYGPINPESWAYNPDIAFSYDQEKAAQLLEQAGFKKGSDGILEKDGKKLEFDIVYLSNDPVRKDIAIAVSSDLEKLGITARPAGKSRDEIKVEDWHGVVIRAGGNPMDPDDYNYKEFTSKFIGQGTLNLASYSNPEAEKLLEGGRTTFDQDKRKQIYDELQKVLVSDMPTAFITFGNTIYATSDKVTGIKARAAPHEHGGLTGELWWNVEEWGKTE
jgi:peptide/nickel transport system substrate-binding protein